jgi:hypothetical protein
METGCPRFKANDNILQFAIDDDIIKICTSTSEKLDTGGSIWHAAYYLSCYLIRNSQLVKGKKILEIGAGCGLVGITAAMLGAKKVIMTDLHDQLSILQTNISLNEKILTNCEVNCACLNFSDTNMYSIDGKLIHQNDNCLVFDLIIGTDLGYDLLLHELLSKSLHYYLNLNCNEDTENNITEDNESLKIKNNFDFPRTEQNIKLLLVEEVRWNDIFNWYVETLNKNLFCSSNITHKTNKTAINNIKNIENKQLNCIELNINDNNDDFLIEPKRISLNHIFDDNSNGLNFVKTIKTKSKIMMLYY